MTKYLFVFSLINNKSFSQSMVFNNIGEAEAEVKKFLRDGVTLTLDEGAEYLMVIPAASIVYVDVTQNRWQGHVPRRIVTKD